MKQPLSFAAVTARILCFALVLALFSTMGQAQDLRIGTVTRAPFSIVEGGRDGGFSIELMNALGADLGRDLTFQRFDTFSEMLEAARTGQVDAAIANISVTAERERMMDFSQPIFESGLRIMVRPSGQSSVSMLRLLFSTELLLALALAFVGLFLGGMFMWWLERRAQPYFDRPARDALFPSFWWALNLVVNGGFEERMPQTRTGRLFAVFLVISSLFIVSVFVARITAAMTVDAIQSNIQDLSDLYGKQVATIESSTAAAYLQDRGISYRGYQDLGSMFTDFQDDLLDAVVFDSPILAYYVLQSNGSAQLAGADFKRENYAIALQSDSPLAEQFNRSLLRLREDGTYATIYRKWFGSQGGN